MRIKRFQLTDKEYLKWLEQAMKRNKKWIASVFKWVKKNLYVEMEIRKH
jgi:hypothetical protein